MAASPTADAVKRPHSIDLSLELEHQLALEEGDGGTPGHAPSNSTSSASSNLDANVLASIVGQLREQLARITSERDDLLGLMSTYVSREADLKDALQDMTDKFTAAKDEVATAREQHASDEENITMLRAKVEESRRGLMKLQTENRRSSVMSTMTLDLSRAGGLAADGPPTSRGAKFTPLTGSGIRPANNHRRGASISSPGLHGIGTPNPRATTPPEEHDDVFARRSTGGSPPKANRRMSGLFGRSISPNTEALSVEALEAKRLRKELDSMREQLEETRAELSEANEARDASETCAKALRDFITENAVGAGSSLPPAAVPAAPKHETKKSVGGGWGFGKLWRADSTASAASHISSGSTSTPLPSIAGSPLSPSEQFHTPQPLTRKLTGFFGQRSDYAASVASTTAAREQEGSISSLEEPAEPISPELGPQPATLLVRTDSLPENRVLTPVDTKPATVEGASSAVTIAVS